MHSTKQRVKRIWLGLLALRTGRRNQTHRRRARQLNLRWWNGRPNASCMSPLGRGPCRWPNAMGPLACKRGHPGL